ncbi:MAG: hypothetical protein BWY69_00126 [Planctomycetes bacterium ADurb.Bin401]|nr:MAG: hypothetical protein BWY69_00126 [Planctomycetes bacterium ADurb.Bin401]
MNENKNDKISRREFFARTAKAGLSVAAVAGAAGLLYESDVLKTIQPENIITGLKDFSVPAIAGKTITVVKGANRTKTVSKAIELLGGIDRFVKPGESVLIKPNVGFSRPPRICATSHPDIIAEVVRLCYEYGKARKVYITDNPIYDAKSCFELSEIAAAAEKNGAQIIMPKSNLFSPMSLKGGKLIQKTPFLYEPVSKVDKVIGVAVIKNHARSGATMTMKNWYGLLGEGRNFFHTNINTIITELATLVKPTFVILDATEIMVSNGPTGGSISDLKRANMMIAGCDQVAVDTFGASLLDLKPTDLQYLFKAHDLKIGTTDYQSLKPIFADSEG